MRNHLLALEAAKTSMTRPARSHLVRSMSGYPIQGSNGDVRVGSKFPVPSLGLERLLFPITDLSGLPRGGPSLAEQGHRRGCSYGRFLAGGKAGYKSAGSEPT